MKTRRCSRGTIVRNAYTRTSASGVTTRVAASCIRDVGVPGKGFRGNGPGIGKLEEGNLFKFGYEHVVKMSAKDRHAALTKAVNEYGYLTVFRKLNAVQVYTRHTSPDSARIFLRDRNWVRRIFGNRKEE